MKALVEMNNMLKRENTKLKQDKQELTRIVEAYKDKGEKEIRRICKAQKRVANTFIKCDKDFIYHDTTGEDILQILNEGDN